MIRMVLGLRHAVKNGDARGQRQGAALAIAWNQRSTAPGSGGSRPEQGRADPHMGGAEAHRRSRNRRSCPWTAPQGRCAARSWPAGRNAARRLVGGRNAHQALDGEAHARRSAAMKASASRRRDAGLLRLLAGVDLDQKRGGRPSWRVARGQGAGQAVAVQGLDDVEQGHRFGGLVALQRTDQAQLEAARRGGRPSGPAPPAPGSRRTPAGRRPARRRCVVRLLSWTRRSGSQRPGRGRGLGGAARCGAGRRESGGAAWTDGRSGR